MGQLGPSETKRPKSITTSSFSTAANLPPTATPKKMAQTSTVLFLSATTTAVPAKIPDFTLRIAFNFLRRFPILLSAECRTVSAKRLRSNIRAIPPQKYVYPDPNPEFAVAETQKFRGELKEKLLKEKGTFGDELDAVVNVCTEIFSEFLHKDYGGPGTLLVEPFTDMMIALKEKKLPGAPLAAREALLWAQNYVDRDWEMWTSETEK